MTMKHTVSFPDSIWNAAKVKSGMANPASYIRDIVTAALLSQPIISTPPVIAHTPGKRPLSLRMWKFFEFPRLASESKGGVCNFGSHMLEPGAMLYVAKAENKGSAERRDLFGCEPHALEIIEWLEKQGDQ